MNTNALLTAIYCGVAFASWGISGKYFGLLGPWVTFGVVANLFLGAGFLAVREGMANGLPSVKGIIFHFLFASVNTLAVILYGNKMVDPKIPPGLFIACCTIVVAMSGPLLDMLFTNGQSLSLRQWMGIALAGLAVYLIGIK